MPHTSFTLIELLVVVSIIAVIAAILLPALTHAKRLARQAACIGQERQLGLASMLYSTDYDNSMLPVTAAIARRDAQSPSEFVDDYAGRETMICPANPGPQYRHCVPNLATSAYFGAPLFNLKTMHAARAEDRWGTPYVLWTDRVSMNFNETQVAHHPWRTYLSTNHRIGDYPAGGNTVFLDGHAEWREWGGGAEWRHGGEDVYFPRGSTHIFSQNATVYSGLAYGESGSCGCRSLVPSGSPDPARIAAFLAAF